MLRRGYCRWLTKRYVACADDLTGPLQTDRRTLLYQYRAIIKCGHRYWDREFVKTSRGCTAGSVFNFTDVNSVDLLCTQRTMELHAARYHKILGNVKRFSCAVESMATLIDRCWLLSHSVCLDNGQRFARDQHRQMSHRSSCHTCYESLPLAW